MQASQAVKDQVQNRLKIQFFELNFSKLIFQSSSTDQQKDRLGQNFVIGVLQMNGKQKYYLILKHYA